MSSTAVRAAYRIALLAGLAGCGAMTPVTTFAGSGARDCGDGTLVRDPRDRFSFCAPFNAWVSTRHVDDEREGPIDTTVYTLEPGASFSVTIHDRAGSPSPFPNDAPVETERAGFHGHEVKHQRVRAHTSGEVAIEQWISPLADGTITVSTQVEDDASPALRARMGEVIESFRYGS